jgi:hypothetical protein
MQCFLQDIVANALVHPSCSCPASLYGVAAAGTNSSGTHLGFEEVALQEKQLVHREPGKLLTLLLLLLLGLLGSAAGCVRSSGTCLGPM